MYSWNSCICRISSSWLFNILFNACCLHIYIRLQEKNIYTAILLFLTVIACQTSTSLFLIIALVFIAIKNKNNKVEILKNSVYTFLIYEVSMLLWLLITIFMRSYLNFVESKTTLLTIKEMIQTLFKYLDFIVLKNFHIKTIWYNFPIIIFLVFIFIILIIKNCIWVWCKSNLLLWWTNNVKKYQWKRISN